MRADIFVLFLILRRKKSSMFHCMYGISFRFFTNTPYQVEEISFYSKFKNFYHEWVIGFCQSTFCTFNVVFALILLVWHVMLIDFQLLKRPCIPAVFPILSWLIILFIYCCISFDNVLFRVFVLFCFFCIHICEGYWFVVVFFF